MRIKIFRVMGTLVILAALTFVFVEEGRARWIFFDNTRGINFLDVCRDGAIFGWSDYISSEVTLEFRLSADNSLILQDTFTLAENTDPDIGLGDPAPYVGYFAVTWPAPLSPGVEIWVYDYFEGYANVQDCTILPPGTPLTSSITYQGQLSEGGSPAEGAFDFQFKLFDSSENGSQVGNVVSLDNVMVSEGLFNAGLDFGADTFTGGARWIEIGVRPGNSTGSYTQLSPRQAISAAPYAQSLLVGAKVSGATDGAALNIKNWTGDGLQIEAAVAGVEVLNSGEDGINILNPGDDGIQVSSAADNGIYIVSPASTGLLIDSAGGSGIRVQWATYDGIYAQTINDSGKGVYGLASATSGTTYGLYGQSDSSSGYGVYGLSPSTSTSGLAFGVRGDAHSSLGTGVLGYVTADSDLAYGVWGYQENPNAYAGYFNGRVNVTGNLTKGGGGFKIDHPLDPENQYLYHSFVESPDMMNIYNGNVELDENGEAWVELPEWFEAVNREFRYQLTPIGAPGPGLYIAVEIADNRFMIAGGAAGMKVSWQVTGVRHDPFAEANRIPVEEEKSAEEQGTYLHPAEWGVPLEQGLDKGNNAPDPGAVGPGSPPGPATP